MGFTFFHLSLDPFFPIYRFIFPLRAQYTKYFPLSQYLENSPLFRLVAWTRKGLSPPLENLTVLVGDTVVDYFSLDYLVMHFGMSATGYDWRHENSIEGYDSRIVRGLLTQRLSTASGTLPFFKRLHSTILFTQCRALRLYSCGEVYILPYLEQIKELIIWRGSIPAYSLTVDLLLVHTLHTLKLSRSTVSWMFGRTFKALKTCIIDHVVDTPEDLSRLFDIGVEARQTQDCGWI